MHTQSKRWLRPILALASLNRQHISLSLSLSSLLYLCRLLSVCYISCCCLLSLLHLCLMSLLQSLAAVSATCLSTVSATPLSRCCLLSDCSLSLSCLCYLSLSLSLLSLLTWANRAGYWSHRCWLGQTEPKCLFTVSRPWVQPTITAFRLVPLSWAMRRPLRLHLRSRDA